jgi:outer membrane protein assembly factor BamB
LTIVGDRVYASDLQQVQVLNAATGETLWAFPENQDRDNYRGTFYAAPAVDGSHVVVASQLPATGFLGRARNVVWGVNADTGDELWDFEGAEGQYIEGGAIADGVFVVGNSDGGVYALDVRSGDLKWRFETGHRVWATPLIDGGKVYIGSMDRHLYALDLSDGNVHWDLEGGGAFASMPILLDGTLYVGAFDNRLYAVGADTGTEVWSFAGENWFWGSPAIHDDIIYSADVDGNVYAVEIATGEQIWQQALEEPMRAGPALTEDGSRLFASGQNGTLYALDTADGAVKWRAEGEGKGLATPVVSGSTVYQTLIQGPQRIRALHVDNGFEVWIHPPETEEE